MFQLLLKPYRHIFHYTVSSLTQSLKISCKHNWSSFFFFSPMISKDTKVSIWGLVLLPPGCCPAGLAHMEPSAGLVLELPRTQYLHQPQEETRNGSKLICLPINLCSGAGRDRSDKQAPISRRSCCISCISFQSTTSHQDFSLGRETMAHLLGFGINPNR